MPQLLSDFAIRVLLNDVLYVFKFVSRKMISWHYCSYSAVKHQTLDHFETANFAINWTEVLLAGISWYERYFCQELTGSEHVNLGKQDLHKFAHWVTESGFSAVSVTKCCSAGWRTRQISDRVSKTLQLIPAPHQSFCTFLKFPKLCWFDFRYWLWYYNCFVQLSYDYLIFIIHSFIHLISCLASMGCPVKRAGLLQVVPCNT